MDRRSEFLIHFAHDRIVVSLAEVYAATDEAVVAVGVLIRRWIESDSVAGEVVVRRNQRRLHPDESSVNRPLVGDENAQNDNRSDAGPATSALFPQAGRGFG